MRLIGYVPDESAGRAFGDYLLVEQIANQLEKDHDGWGVWITDEDKITQATSLLADFNRNPLDPKYRSASAQAAKLRHEAEEDRESYQKRVRNRRHLFKPLTPYSFGPLTFILIAMSVTVFFLSGYGYKHEPIMKLFITEFAEGMYNRTLPEIRHGEVWRLLTPIFIHFGPIHILFNMLWLRDLGSMIEARQSIWHLAILVVAIAVCSNAAQFFVEKSPVFGGMSGVVYGLLGYIWLRGKFDPGSGLYLHSSTVIMMIIWFFACLTGFLGTIANTAHAVGLAMGMAWGYLSSLRYR